jgi:hypothetical protein
MTDPNRIAGFMEITQNGTKLRAAGAFSYDLGLPKREGIVGPDAHHGYSEKPKIPYIEGMIIVDPNLSITDICSTTGASIVLTLATGKQIMLGDAYYSGDGTGDTEGGTLQVRFDGMRANEV